MSRREFKPWKMVESQLGGVHHIFQDGGSRDWEISVSGDVEIAELVLRAPELLEALEAHLEYRNSGMGGSSSRKAQAMRARMWDLTEAAIRKARGE